MKFVTLTFGEYTTMQGSPRTVEISVTGPKITDLTTGDVFDPHVVAWGKSRWSIKLPATDDSNITPRGFTYEITVDGKVKHVSLPYDVTNVDYDSLTGEETSQGIVYYPARVKGDPGDPGEASPEFLAGVLALKNSTVTVAGYTDAAVAAAGESFTAAQSAQSAEASAIAARDDAAAITGLTGEDVAVAYLVKETTSATHAAVVRLMGGVPVPSTPGEAFPALTALPMPTNIRVVGDTYTADLNYSELMPSVGVTYYTAPVSSGTNDGLTPATPIPLVNAIAKADVGTIVFADGEYDRNRSLIAGNVTKSLRWVAADGARPKITGWNGVAALSWTLTSGNIYQASRSATASVVDIQTLTAWGDYTIYTKKADLASITGPGQWAIVGSIVYVWALGNTDLSVAANREQIRLQISSKSGVVAEGAGVVQYVKGIDFHGCSTGAGTSLDGGVIAYNGATIVAEDCTVKYNVNDDGFQTVGGGHIISIGCEASSNARDGFNYHDTANAGGEFVEIGCTSHHNGTDGSTNNGSTAHEKVRGVRIGGHYYMCGGPVVADVNSAKTWNVGVKSGDSATTVLSQKSAFRTDATDSADPATMWLENCVAYSVNTGLKTTGVSVIRQHDTSYTGVTIPTEGDVRNY